MMRVRLAVADSSCMAASGGILPATAAARMASAVWPELGGSGTENGPPSRVLCYTVALDQPGETWYRQQAHLLVASLLKTGFEGDIKVFHNGAQEIFTWPRRGVEEIPVDLPEGGRHQC